MVAIPVVVYTGSCSGTGPLGRRPQATNHPIFEKDCTTFRKDAAMVDREVLDRGRLRTTSAIAGQPGKSVPLLIAG